MEDIFGTNFSLGLQTIVHFEVWSIYYTKGHLPGQGREVIVVECCVVATIGRNGCSSSDSALLELMQIYRNINISRIPGSTKRTFSHFVKDLVFKTADPFTKALKILEGKPWVTETPAGTLNWGDFNCTFAWVSSLLEIDIEITIIIITKSKNDAPII